MTYMVKLKFELNYNEGISKLVVLL